MEKMEKRTQCDTPHKEQELVYETTVQYCAVHSLITKRISFCKVLCNLLSW